MLAKFSSVIMAPSILITKTRSRKRGIYWRMPRRSVNFTGIVFTVGRDAAELSGQILRQRSVWTLTMNRRTVNPAATSNSQHALEVSRAGAPSRAVFLELFLPQKIGV